ncbi:MAG: hypothetical protein H7210_07725 [Pyrinomonadaceae bacterium]|nr:hypothetical protein [Phycisphaerales bacterium]
MADDGDAAAACREDMTTSVRLAPSWPHARPAHNAVSPPTLTPTMSASPRPLRHARSAAACRALLAALLTSLAACTEHVPKGDPIKSSIVFGGLGDTPGHFAYPRAMTPDPDTNSLWVIDKTARVQQIDATTGGCLTLWKMPLTDNGKPTGCTLSKDPAGHTLVYIPDTHYHRVMIYRPTPPERTADGDPVRHTDQPELVGSFGEYGAGPGQFIFPTDVAILPTPGGLGVERIYVSEYGGNDRVSVFDAGYLFLFSFGTFGASSDAATIEFDRPQSLAVVDVHTSQGHSEKQVIVTDSRNHRVGRFSLDGKLIAWMGAPDGPGDGPGEFRIPYGLEPLGDGTILVTELGNNRLQRIELATGQGLGTWGRPGRSDGELASPWASAVIGKTTYVLDTGNNRVLGFPTPALKKRSRN